MKINPIKKKAIDILDEIIAHMESNKILKPVATKWFI